MLDAIRQFIWTIMFEYITDIDPADPTRMSGVAKPTRLSKIVNYIVFGKGE